MLLDRNLESRGSESRVVLPRTEPEKPVITHFKRGHLDARLLHLEVQEGEEQADERGGQTAPRRLVQPRERRDARVHRLQLAGGTWKVTLMSLMAL